MDANKDPKPDLRNLLDHMIEAETKKGTVIGKIVRLGPRKGQVWMEFHYGQNVSLQILHETEILKARKI